MAFYETIYENTCGSCRYFRWPRSKFEKGKCTYKDREYYSDEKVGDCTGFWAIRSSSEAEYIDEDEDNSSSSGGCFLTTACCEYKGLPDDCYELTTLRYLRDSYMKKSLVGSKLVDLYYDIAPDIVEKINLLDNKKEIYEEIYQEIQKIVVLIEDTKYTDAVGKYIDIMLGLDRKINSVKTTKQMQE